MKIESWISNIMLVMILIAVAMMLYGGSIYLLHHGHEVVHDQIFQREPQSLIDLKMIWKGACHQKEESIMMLGALTIIATQVLRVLLIATLFAYQRDRLFCFLSLLILLVMLVSFL